MAKKKRQGGMKKGGPFEREISSELSYWWTNGERDDIIWRTAGSGARAKTRSKTGVDTKYQYGDLTFIDPTAQPLFDFFLFELKRGYTKNISILTLLDKLDHRKDPQIIEWWEEGLIDKDLGKRKELMIIFKRDAHKPCVVISGELFSKISTYSDGYNYPYMEICNMKYELVVCLFSDFFTWLAPEDIAFFS